MQNINFIPNLKHIKTKITFIIMTNIWNASRLQIVCFFEMLDICALPIPRLTLSKTTTILCIIYSYQLRNVCLILPRPGIFLKFVIRLQSSRLNTTKISISIITYFNIRGNVYDKSSYFLRNTRTFQILCNQVSMITPAALAGISDYLY